MSLIVAIKCRHILRHSYTHTYLLNVIRFEEHHNVFKTRNSSDLHDFPILCVELSVEALFGYFTEIAFNLN
jgi:hypothetical protein